tara:strand:+ start:8446 stop:8667 length:222 start_codon:yes stop_codon:yes gene_type:complete
MRSIKEAAEYADTRREDTFKAREVLKKKGMVYKNDYELVMNHYPIKWGQSSKKIVINEIPRMSGGTLNGSSYR